jgi:hypothetical protein
MLAILSALALLVVVIAIVLGGLYALDRAIGGDAH